MKKKTRIAIIGYGNVGENVYKFINHELKNKAEVVAVVDINPGNLNKLKGKKNIKLCDMETAVKECDLVLESATGDCAYDLLKLALKYRRDILILSVGGLIRDFDLLDKIIASGLNVYVPSGAICGLDGIGALSEGDLSKIVITTSKPPKGLMGAEYLKTKKICLDNLTAPVTVFHGNVFDAIKFFPKNINVAATLLLATYVSSCNNVLTSHKKDLLEKKVNVRIDADPSIKRNVHKIEIFAKEAKVKIEVENVPSKGNPKTST
ncbi:MAG: aspartate dehydrogenase domain-containing protein, partial [Candidatus Omnitrophota bacterium]